MGKIIKLTEKELINMVKTIVNEQAANMAKTAASIVTPQINDRIKNIAGTIMSLQKKNVPTFIVTSKNPKLNGMTWGDYQSLYKVNANEIKQAEEFIKKSGGRNPTKPGMDTNPKPNIVPATKIKPNITPKTKPTTQTTGNTTQKTVAPATNTTQTTGGATQQPVASEPTV